MYSPSILSTDIRQGKLYIIVQFTDGTDTFNEEFVTNSGADPDWLKKAVGRRLADINSLSELKPELGTFDPTIPAAPIPQAEMKKRNYREKLVSLQRLSQLVQLGVIPSGDSTVASAKQWLKDNYQPEFLDQV